jgi:mono/diheme cytochrome c family protein
MQRQNCFWLKAGWRWGCWTLFSILLHNLPSRAQNEVEIRFNRDIRPILSDACFSCHGPDKHGRQADLRLDLREEAIGYGAIVAGDASASAIIARMISHDPDEVMPPPKTGKVLTAEQIDRIRRWIDAGAPYEPHWAFVPVPASVALPPLSEAWRDWPSQELDYFVLAELLDRDMEPALPSEPLRWLRRARFDLTGLPPTVEEIQELTLDPSDACRERIVDRLLQNPAFGERMANMWLDVARYADTFGYQSDVNMEVWPWRDWVIEAFNQNLPYNQFIEWQIAGDLLPDATDTQRLATAFHRLHRQTNEGGSIEEEFRQVYVADRTVTAGTAFLGLTLECSRCHDHKYDPISQKDYYSFAAYFADIDEHGLYSHFTRGTPTPALSLYTPEQKRQHAQLKSQIADLESRLAQWVAKERESRQPQTDDTAFDSSSIVGEPPITPWSFPLEGMADGVIGKSTRFNGDDAIAFPLTLPDASDPSKSVQVQLGRPDPFSISIWVRPEQHADRVVLVHQSQAAEDSAFRGLQLVLHQGKPQFSLIHFWPGDALRVEAIEAIPIQRWTHIGVTYDGSSRASGVRLFIDGKHVPQTIDRDQLTRDFRHRGEWGDSSAGSLPISLGARFRDIGFRDGCMDELRIYDFELHATDMARLFAQSTSLAESDRTSAVAAASASWDHRSMRGNPQYDALLDALHEARRQENELVVHVRQIMAMAPSKKPRKTYVLERGAYDAPGEEVAPSTIPAATQNTTRFDRSDAPNDRLQLARWMLDDQNPLVSRVAVNRFWALFFGRGIVASLEDFGNQGQPPTHPELLDALARRWMDHGWNVKQLCKEMVLSSTYRQSSLARQPQWEQADPNNLWLARGPKHRLSAEQVRDSVLFASGLLVPSVGGPSVMPYQPEGVWEESGTGKSYQQSQGEGLYRRSLYTFWRRTAPPPSMLAFDATSRETCTARRETTTTPLQALVLLNDPQTIEAARAVSEQVIAIHQTDRSARWEAIGLRLISRPLSHDELAVVEQAYLEQYAYFQTRPESTAAFLHIGQRPVDSSIDAIDLASTSVVAGMLMCFDEFVMKR